MTIKIATGDTLEEAVALLLQLAWLRDLKELFG